MLESVLQGLPCAYCPLTSLANEVTVHLNQFLNEDDNTSESLKTAWWFNEHRTPMPMPYNKLTYFPSCFFFFLRNKFSIHSQGFPCFSLWSAGITEGFTIPAYICYFIRSNQKGNKSPFGGTLFEADESILNSQAPPESKVFAQMNQVVRIFHSLCVCLV